MSQVTDAVATMETSFAKVSTDLSALAGKISALEAQIAASGTLSTADAAALAQVVSDANALALAADNVVNPAPAPTP